VDDDEEARKKRANARTSEFANLSDVGFRPDLKLEENQATDATKAAATRLRPSRPTTRQPLTSEGAPAEPDEPGKRLNSRDYKDLPIICASNALSAIRPRARSSSTRHRRS